MAQTALKKLLKKNRRTHGVIAGLIEAIGPGMAVEDADGALLLGPMPGPDAQRTALERDGQVLGWVYGDGAASAGQARAFANLLSALLLHEEEKRALAGEMLDKYRELNLLYTLSERLLVEPDPVAIARLALNEAGRLIDATAGWLLLWDGQQATPLSSTGVGAPASDRQADQASEHQTSEHQTSERRLPAGIHADSTGPTHQPLILKKTAGGEDGLLARVLRRREAEIDNEAQGQRYFEDSPLDRCALLCAPLKTEQRVLGAILLAGADPISYAARDRKLLNTVALQVAPALEMARLYQVAVEKGRMERELQLAYQVQAGLIPRQTPQMVGWQFAGSWRPARELSGDYYDFIEESDGRLGLVIGDVADKGMPSALFMVHARAAMRTAIRTNHTPAQVLFEANKLVQPESKQGHFVTLLYASLDTNTGRLAFANAGHNPGLIYDAKADRFHELKRCGLPLGILPDAPYEQGRATLAAGNLLLLYTDGLTEAVNGAMEEFGLQRLKETIRSGAQGTAQELIAAIEQALDAFVGDAPPFDDVTLVVVKAAPAVP